MKAVSTVLKAPASFWLMTQVGASPPVMVGTATEVSGAQETGASPGLLPPRRRTTAALCSAGPAVCSWVFVCLQWGPHQCPRQEVAGQVRLHAAAHIQVLPLEVQLQLPSNISPAYSAWALKSSPGNSCCRVLGSVPHRHSLPRPAQPCPAQPAA